jgi:hypothetical protein
MTTNVCFFFLFFVDVQIILKDKQFFKNTFGEEWSKRTEGTGILEGIFPVTLSYNLKGNSMRLTFSDLLFKTVDDAVVWDTRKRKRGVEQAQEQETKLAKKINPIFTCDSLE